MSTAQKADNTPVLCIAGPTASGKSSLAIDMALRFDAEIVSVDSMQLYKGMDIGSAKPSREEQKMVRHHLIDLFSLTESVTVSTYCKMAREIMADIRSRGKKIILCGGSGLYLKTLLYGMDDLPADPVLRAGLEAKFPSPDFIPALRDALAAKDHAAKKLPQLSLRRLLRLLEITELTGSLPPLAGIQQEHTLFPAVVWILQWEREELKSRIRTRTEAMLEAGWIEEAKSLTANGLLQTPTARQAIGYKQISDFLAGAINREELVEQIATKTWQFARRQLTWFRNQHPEAEFIPMPVQAENLISWPEPGRNGNTGTKE